MVSVVIPCRNEVKAIATTVRALLKSHHPEIEVLVVDGMSEDGTRAVVSELIQQDGRVRLIDNPNKLTPFAFNLGIVHARGEYIQIVGSRNVLDPDYIPILVQTLENKPDVACVGGDYQHVFETTESRYISLAMESKFGVGAGNYRTMQGDTYVDTVGIPLYRKSIFKGVGMFDENLTRNQDDEFNYRLRQCGHKILYVHQAKATYLVRGSLKKAFEQFFQYGYFKVFVNRKHRAVTTIRQMIPALFIAFWVVWAMAILVFPPLWILGAAVATLYILTGLMWAGFSLGLGERIQVFKACVVLHAGYGLGYWQGIFDFLLLNRTPRLHFQRQTL